MNGICSIILAAAAIAAPPSVDQATINLLHEHPDDAYIKPDPAQRQVTLGKTVETNGFVSIQVNVDSNGNNIVGDAANETSIAVDPLDRRRMAIGWRQFDTTASNFRQAGYAYTRDFGRTWSADIIEPGVFRSDPVLDTDLDGNFYYYSLVCPNPANCGDYQMDLLKSIDGGMTWQGPVYGFGGDKPWMAVDKSDRVDGGNIYGIWQQFFSCCGSDTLTRSVDGGMSFQQPVEIDFSPIFGILTVGPTGNVYAAGARGDSTQDFSTIVVSRSSNAKNPMQTPVSDVAEIVNLNGSLRIGNGSFSLPNPSGLLGQVYVAATFPSPSTSEDRVYVLASVNPPGADPLDVYIAVSDDGGMTWGAPHRVNDDSTSASSWQWFGTLAVAPNGRIDAVWNDTRDSGQPNICQTYYSFSTNGGQNWSPNVAITPTWNSHLGFPNQNKIGDYYQMVSDNFGADLAFAATFNGEEDVYYMRIGDRDCNNNHVADSADLNAGTSLDCNANALPDECETDCNNTGVPDDCETIAAGDYNGDSVIGPSDYAGLAECLAGPLARPFLSDRTCSSICLAAFDFDTDQDIDLIDFAEFSRVFTGK